MKAGKRKKKMSTDSTKTPSDEIRPHACMGTSDCSVTCEICGAFLPDSDGEDAIAIVLRARAWLQTHGYDPDYKGQVVNDMPNAKNLGDTLWSILLGQDEKNTIPANEEDFDIAEHFHGLGRSRGHTHAWAFAPHNHMLRAICGEPECKEFQTHNIHPGKSD